MTELQIADLSISSDLSFTPSVYPFYDHISQMKQQEEEEQILIYYLIRLVN